MRKLKVFGLPVLLILIAIALVNVHHLQEQAKSPSPNWSRSIPITKVAEDTDLEVIKSNQDYKLYIPKNGMVSEITLNEKLEQVGEKNISVNIPSDSSFWVDEQGNMVYIREGNLYHYVNNKENLIHKEVKGMSTLDNRIVYWSETEVFELSTKGFKVSSLIKVNHPIEEVTIGKNSKSFIVSYAPKEKFIVVDYYFLDNQNTYKSISLKEMLNSRSQFYVGASFVENEGMTHVIYTTLSLASGASTYTGYYSTFDPSIIKETPKFEVITLKSEKTGRFINPEKEVFLRDDNGPKLWFVAKGEITRRDTAINIFEAYPTKENTWLANPRSRTYDISHVPFYHGDNIIFWKEFNPGSNFENILAASTDPYLIDKASQRTKSDLTHATSDSIISLTGGVFIVLLFGLLWITLPLLLLFFLQENLLENHPNRVNFGVMTLFVIVQIIVGKWILGDAFYHYAPPYLTFTGASIIVFLIIAVISWLVTRAAKSKEWGIIKETTYFMVVNIIISMFVIGPYIL